MEIQQFNIGERVWVYSGPDGESEEEGTKGIPHAHQGTVVGYITEGTAEGGPGKGYMVKLDCDSENESLEEGRELLWMGPDKPHCFSETAYGGYYCESVMISA